jgi:hypothetical protein
MRLTSEQLEFYVDNGFVFLPGCFSPADVAVFKNEIPVALAEDTLRRVTAKKRQRSFGPWVAFHERRLQAPLDTLENCRASNANCRRPGVCLPV